MCPWVGVHGFTGKTYYAAYYFDAIVVPVVLSVLKHAHQGDCPTTEVAFQVLCTNSIPV